MIPAGSLRHRVVIERPARAETASGEKAITSWTLVGKAWAAVTTPAAMEAEENRQATHRTTHELRLRYRDDLTPDCRIIYKGKHLAIVSLVNVDEANGEWLIRTSTTD